MTLLRVAVLFAMCLATTTVSAASPMWVGISPVWDQTRPPAILTTPYLDDAQLDLLRDEPCFAGVAAFEPRLVTLLRDDGEPVDMLVADGSEGLIALLQAAREPGSLEFPRDAYVLRGAALESLGLTVDTVPTTLTQRIQRELPLNAPVGAPAHHDTPLAVAGLLPAGTPWFEELPAVQAFRTVHYRGSALRPDGAEGFTAPPYLVLRLRDDTLACRTAVDALARRLGAVSPGQAFRAHRLTPR